MDFNELSASHEDIVHDIVFDFYGKRFATCSSDKHIKIWSLNEETGTWSYADISRAHNDSIWRLSWAHPEFGQLLASCSEDNSICIWEEHESVTMVENPKEQKWTKKTRLVDSKKSVNCVKFSHRSLGLKLAAACADGFIRIYDAPDVFDLSKWDLSVTYQVEDTTVSSSNTTSRPVTSTNNSNNSATFSEHGLMCVSWNDCPFEPSLFAVGGYSKRAVVYSLKGNTLNEECVLGLHENVVHDIAWAPAMGRSYHMIATASRESTFRIHTLKRRDDGSLEYVSTEAIESTTKSNVWRVAWNATGTGEDGFLSLWRKNFGGTWVSVQSLPYGGEAQMHYFYKNS